MLFNSYIFIFIFIPVVFLGFFSIGKHSHSLASLWLAVASLFFYGWWDVRFVAFLLGSIVFNYGVGYLIGHRVAKRSKILFVGAIAINLILLCYFKYAYFFAENYNYFMGKALPIGDVILPLGISFFTFTQIAFLADTYQSKVKELNFVHYTLFVTYFPHLIAGPVLHHKEMMPQFAKRNVCHINWNNVAVGLTIFVLGLAKKVLIADSLAGFSAPIFDAVKAGGKPMLFEAWTGALAYTLQLYFDFSAYSDMAIGLSLMFNVRLPINFNSPYKATSIIEFWRCWHITLSRFLRDYLYIPLGGSRNGKTQRYLNLMTTMLLGGLWHGAGWTFVIWGGLHGCYIIVNHAWRAFKQRVGWCDGGRLAIFGAASLTFLAVVVGWVFFRADSYSSAMTMLHGMTGMNGVSMPRSMVTRLSNYFPSQDWLVYSGLLPLSRLNSTQGPLVLVIALAITWCLPNVQQIWASYKPHSMATVKTSEKPASEGGAHLLMWKPSLLYGLAYSMIFCACLFAMMNSDRPSPFLYFQF